MPCFNLENLPCWEGAEVGATTTQFPTDYCHAGLGFPTAPEGRYSSVETCDVAGEFFCQTTRDGNFLHGFICEALSNVLDDLLGV